MPDSDTGGAVLCREALKHTVPPEEGAITHFLCLSGVSAAAFPLTRLDHWARRAL